MHEDLHLAAAPCFIRRVAGRRKVPDLLQAQFPGRHDAADAEFLHQFHRLRVIHRGLGRQVDRQFRKVLSQHTDQTHVRRDDGIRADLPQRRRIVESVRQLPVLQQSIEGHVDLHAALVGIADGIPEPGQGEILSLCAGIKTGAAQIDRVRTVIDCCIKLRRSSDRRKQFRYSSHYFFTLKDDFRPTILLKTLSSSVVSSGSAM